MFGLFGLFGKARGQERLDDCLRQAGLHPATLDEAIKLTLLRLLRGRGEGAAFMAELQSSADLLVYCILGPTDFRAKNGPAAAEAQERRLTRAGELGQGLDAEIVLLCLHSGLASETLAERFEWTTTPDL